MPGVLVVLPIEREVLANVPSDQCVSLHLEDELVFNKLAELMDIRNGEIGFNSAISTHKIASELTEKIKTKAVGNRNFLSRGSVRRSIDRLVKVGLLERHSIDKKLQLVRVYWRDFTALCHSVKIQESTQESTVVENSMKQLSYLISNLHDYKKVMHSQESTQESTHNKPTTTTRIFDEKFKIETSYVFKDVLLDEISTLLRFDYKKIDDRWRDEFLLYQRSNGRSLNEFQWHDKYCREMKIYVDDPARFDELNGRKPVVKLATVKLLIPAVPHYTNVEAMNKFANKYSFIGAKPGESGGEFNRRLNSERMKRLDYIEKEEAVK